VGLATLALPTVPTGPDAQPSKVAGEWYMPRWVWWAFLVGLLVMFLVMRTGCSLGR
jgi:hypothetical protein